ncbi:MAG: J domain-containing protein [Sarcina sp.]
MKSYYEILGVENTATLKDIKRAYNKLVRQYPPDKEEEMFKVIREAYDILSDTASRATYDTNFVREDDNEIEFLWDVVGKTLEEKNYKLAKDLYIKILEKQPNLPNAVDGYGFACFRLEQYEEAIEVYKKLIKLVPDNSEYYRNFAFIYSGAGRSVDAYKMIEEAYKLDPISEEIFEAYCDIYITSGKIGEALEIIDTHYDALGQSADDKCSICLNKLVKLYELIGVHNANISVDDLKKFISVIFKEINKVEVMNNELELENRNIFARQFLFMAKDSFENRRFESGELLMKAAKELDIKNQINKVLYDRMWCAKDIRLLREQGVPSEMLEFAHECVAQSEEDEEKQKAIFYEAGYKLACFFIERREVFCKHIDILNNSKNFMEYVGDFYSFYYENKDKYTELLIEYERLRIDSRIHESLVLFIRHGFLVDCGFEDSTGEGGTEDIAHRLQMIEQKRVKEFLDILKVDYQGLNKAFSKRLKQLRSIMGNRPEDGETALLKQRLIQAIVGILVIVFFALKIGRRLF